MPGQVTKYEYFTIHKLPLARGRKTHVYVIRSKDDIELGQIKWYGAWRQYCFWPNGETIWNGRCLQNIQGFLDKLRGPPRPATGKSLGHQTETDVEMRS